MPNPKKKQNRKRHTTPPNIDSVAHAVVDGDYNKVRRFITAGANVNDIPTIFPTGCTLLMCACEQDDYDCARLLIENGADLNKGRTDDGSTPLCKSS